MRETISEVRNDFIDEDINVTYIDAWFTEDDGEEGKTIAVVCNDTLKVIFFYNRYRGDEKIIVAIEEVKSKMAGTFWVLAWCEKILDHNGYDSTYTDYYHRFDNLEDAKSQYQETLLKDTLFSISLCKEIEGTDS